MTETRETELAQAYRQVFGGAEGQRVLHDILRRAYAVAPLVHSDRTDRIDPQRLLVRASRRDLAFEIARLAYGDPMKAIAAVATAGPDAEAPDTATIEGAPDGET